LPLEPRRIAPERRTKSGERIEYCQIEPISPFERILKIPFGECTVDVGLEPIAQSPSDEHAQEDYDGAGPEKRRSQSDLIRFVVCFGRQRNKPPSGLADTGLHQNARQDSWSTHVVSHLKFFERIHLTA
jgi:hypothetical protein